MGKITSQTLETKSIHETDHDLKVEKVFFEKLKDETYAMECGLTTMGYDEEIGLWEELEHRFRRRLQINRAGNGSGSSRNEGR